MNNLLSGSHSDNSCPNQQINYEEKYNRLSELVMPLVNYIERDGHKLGAAIKKLIEN